ncbi:MAG: shikimate dehydrogenase family protein, partial [Tepidisphaeraceae bacterium]
GAVNTIAIDSTGLRGSNTDYPAIIQTICDALAIEANSLSDKRVAVIGAGGTARAAVAALADSGATVVIYNRTRERADTLAREFDGRSGKVVAARLEKLCDSCCHIFINATPVGMFPDIDHSPLGGHTPGLSPDTLVLDTIYNPLKTKFLEQAESAGAKTANGLDVFIRQAAAQFERWTGRPAPTAVMREAFHKYL